jgi:hypothetical protein
MLENSLLASRNPGNVYKNIKHYGAGISFEINDYKNVVQQLGNLYMGIDTIKKIYSINNRNKEIDFIRPIFGVQLTDAKKLNVSNTSDDIYKPITATKNVLTVDFDGLLTTNKIKLGIPQCSINPDDPNNNNLPTEKELKSNILECDADGNLFFNGKKIKFEE